MLFTYPALFLGGAALVSVPIIIHLLNKRKFKVVDWAAMDFLFEADKKNRRRVRLEDLLILLLRVAAVLLVAALLARPVLSGASAALVGGKVGVERIVLLDDSPSMEARQEGTTALAEGKKTLTELVRQLSTDHQSDTVTVLVTSRAHKPIVKQELLTPETVEDLTSKLGALPVSSRPAHYGDAFVELEKLLKEPTSQANRMVYVISDLRDADWNAAKASGDAAADPLTVLKRIANDTAGCFLVDVGSAQTENLAITSLAPLDKLQIAGDKSRFEAQVHNHGPAAVENVTVRLTHAGSRLVNAVLPQIAAGQTAALPLEVMFPAGESDREPEPVALQAELVLSGGVTEDRLAADNSRYYPARVTQGIRTLVVDGDPTSNEKRAEAYFLERGLKPPGDVRSAIVPQVVDSSKFESLDLGPYQVVYLANVNQISDERRTTLEDWVKRGGGLVIVLGDQLADLGWFNARMYRSGTGLAPAEVQSLQGNDHRRKWAKVVVEDTKDSEAMYKGESKLYLENVKIFRWWKCQLPESEVQKGQVRLLARLTDGERSPLLVERNFGRGRVALLTTPLDKDWSTWPKEQHAYFLFVQFLTRIMAQPTTQPRLIQIGEEIKVPLDTARHQLEAITLTRPSGERSGIAPKKDQVPGSEGAVLPAAAIQASGGSTGSAAKGEKTVSAQQEAAAIEGLPASVEPTWHIATSETDAPGVYRIELPLHGGGTESALFAANLAGDESILAPLDAAGLKEQLADSRVQLLAADALLAVEAKDAKREWWPLVLGGLGIVLGTEQLLAWLFGRRR